MHKAIIVIFVILLFSCNLEPKISLISKKQNLEENVSKKCGFNSSWRLTGTVDGDELDYEFITAFERRWINGKSQWIPTHGEFQYWSYSDPQFKMIPYAPQIKFEVKDGWVSYDFSLELIVGEKVKDPFWVTSGLYFEYLTFNTEWESLDGMEFKNIKFQNMDYDNIDPKDRVTISKKLRFDNSDLGLKMEEVVSFEQSLQQLKLLDGMGDSEVIETSSFQDILNVESPKIAGYKTIAKIPGVKGVIIHCTSLEEWLKFKDESQKNGQ